MNFLSSLFAPAIPSIQPQEAQERLNQSPKPFLLDVREISEFRQANISGATLIPSGELASKLNRLPKDKEILVICASGSRSSSATRQLIAAGYRAVNIQGGMFSWMRAGLPVKK